MIPLREDRTKKINIEVAGKIQKSFRAKDAGCETAPFFGSAEYNSIVTSMHHLLCCYSA